MFANPTEAGPLSPSLLHHGACIDIGAVAVAGSQSLDVFDQLRQSLAQDVMVVSAPRIAGDPAVSRTFIGSMLRVVVHPHGNDGATTRKHKPGIGSPFASKVQADRARLIPNADVVVIPGARHEVSWTHVDECVAVLTAQTRAATRDATD